MCCLKTKKEITDSLAGTQFELGVPRAGGAVYKMHLSPEN